MTHSDVPGAFSVGFVVTGESFTGHDARVCDQVASAVEDGPEREYRTTTISCNIWFDMQHWRKTQPYWEYWGRAPAYTHTHTFLHTHWKPHSLSLFSEFGEVPGQLSWFVFFHKTWSNQARKTVNIQYTCCELSPHTDCTTRKSSADVRHTLLQQTGSFKQPGSHMEFGDTHPPFHAQINTDQSGTSLGF